MKCAATRQLAGLQQGQKTLTRAGLGCVKPAEARLLLCGMHTTRKSFCAQAKKAAPSKGTINKASKQTRQAGKDTKGYTGLKRSGVCRMLCVTHSPLTGS